MAELLDPNQTAYIPVPAGQVAKPVAQPQERTGVDRLRSEPQKPQRPTFVTRTGPPLLILPHAPGTPQPPDQGQQPVQQARGGRPVRLSTPQDALGLFANAVGNPKDRAHWLMLSDAFDDMGKPHTGRLMRELADHFGGNPAAWGLSMYDALKGDRWGAAPSTFATLGGLHADIYPMVRREEVEGLSYRNDLRPVGWGLHLHLPGDTHNRVWAILPEDHGRGILHEMDRDRFDDPDVAERRGQVGHEPWFYSRLDEFRPRFPARLRRGRPVRLSADVVGLHQALVENPHDQGRWLMLADALADAGKPAASRGVRLVAQGDPLLAPKQLSYMPKMLLGSGPGIKGVVAGMPLRLVPLSDNGWRLHVEDHTHGWTAPFGIAELDRVTGDTMLHEMEAQNPDQERALRIARTWTGPERMSRPERFAAAQAPGGTGLLARGIMYKPGEFVPAPMPAPPPAQPVAPKRTRLRGVLRKPSVKAARPVLDLNFVRGLKEAGEDAAPWLGFADHIEEQGMPHLAAALRAPETTKSAATWNPGESWERPDYMAAAGFPSWTQNGANGYVDLKYYPDHGAATVRYKAYEHAAGIGERGAERTAVLRGHDRIRDLAHEMMENQLEDGERDWADEFEAIRDEAARRAATQGDAHG